MRGDSENRSRYLSLALLSRRTIEGLRGVTAGNPVDRDLDKSLRKLLAGVSSTGDTAFVKRLEASGAWTRFEELSTLDEVKAETGTDSLDEIVSSILSNQNEELKIQNAKLLIRFLTAVEGRALQRYTDSMEMQFA
ncbi:MAG: hypothetical protein ABSC47_09765 [Terracidiphilus sp.]